MAGLYYRTMPIIHVCDRHIEGGVFAPGACAKLSLGLLNVRGWQGLELLQLLLASGRCPYSYLDFFDSFLQHFQHIPTPTLSQQEMDARRGFFCILQWRPSGVALPDCRARTPPIQFPKDSFAYQPLAKYQ